MNDHFDDETTLKQVKDPVCGMTFALEEAAATIDHGAHAHYFCSEQCKQEFEKNPRKYH